MQYRLPILIQLLYTYTHILKEILQIFCDRVKKNFKYILTGQKKQKAVYFSKKKSIKRFLNVF